MLHHLKTGMFFAVFFAGFSAALAADTLVLPKETPSDIANLYLDTFTRLNAGSAKALNEYTQRATGTQGTFVNIEALQRVLEKNPYTDLVEALEIGATAEQQQANKQALTRFFSAFTQGIRKNNCRADPVATIRPNTAQKGLNVIASVTVRCEIAALNLGAAQLQSQISQGSDLPKLVNTMAEQLGTGGETRQIVRDFDFYASKRNLYWMTGGISEFGSWITREMLAIPGNKPGMRQATLLDALSQANLSQKRPSTKPANASPGQLDSKLNDAVLANDMVKAQKLLTAGANPTPSAETSSIPPLLAAIDAEKAEMVKLLLPKSDPTWTSANGANSLLMYAVVKGDTSLEISRALLDAGAKVDAVNPVMGTPLLIALHNLQNKPMDKTITLLLERGADVNLEGTRFEGKPLVEAAKSLSALQILFASGKLSPTTTKDAKTPVHGMCTRGIYSEADAQKEQQEAAQRVRLLLGKGFQLDAKDKDGNTALNAYPSNLPCMMVLADAGADVNIANTSGSGPIFQSFYDDTARWMDKLLQKGAKINSADNIGSTPLHEAALQKNPVFIKKLLAAGAKANATDQFGWTPLGLAQAIGYAENIRLLQAAK